MSGQLNCTNIEGYMGVYADLAHRNRSDFCDLRLRCPSRTPENAAISETRERGGVGSDPVLVGPPRKRSLAMVMCLVYILVNSAFVFGMVIAPLSWFVCEESIVCGHVGSDGPAKSRTQPLGVSVI